LLTLLTDICAPSGMMVVKQLSNVNVLILCAGVSTRGFGGTDKKGQLFEKNNDLVNEWVAATPARIILLATNPCSEIGSGLAGPGMSPVYAVGLQNDNRRFFHSAGSNAGYLIGRHHFTQLLLGLSNGNGTARHDFSLDAYRDISKCQDDLLAANSWLELGEHVRSLSPTLRWWASQRLNTVVNGSSHSCAEATVEILTGLLKREGVVTLESRFRFAEIAAKPVYIGWPVNLAELSPLALQLEVTDLERLLLGQDHRPNA